MLWKSQLKNFTAESTAFSTFKTIGCEISPQTRNLRTVPIKRQNMNMRTKKNVIKQTKEK